MNDAVQISKNFFRRLIVFSVILSFLSTLTVDLWHSHHHAGDVQCTLSSCCTVLNHNPDDLGNTLRQGNWEEYQSHDCALCMAVKFQFAKYFQINDTPKHFIVESFALSSVFANPTIKQNRVNTGRAPPLA